MTCTFHFYSADGLKECMVGSYDEISAKQEEGTLNRTVASTNMNATSSRAHTIVGITFVQKVCGLTFMHLKLFQKSSGVSMLLVYLSILQSKATGKEMAKTAVVNLVDLAGSERVDSTGATGDRLKEVSFLIPTSTCNYLFFSQI